MTTWQEFLGKRYYQNKAGYFLDRRGEAMARAVWKHYRGPIPADHHVHHIDHDRGNNAIDNLELLERSVHIRNHAPDAAEWHRSDEGRAWHVEHGRDSWKNAVEETFECTQCGKSYTGHARARKRGFCSPYCQTKARILSGVDDEDRICIECGAWYRANRYSPVKTCSRSCGTKVAYHKRVANGWVPYNGGSRKRDS
jgi:hypothetical protein